MISNDNTNRKRQLAIRLEPLFPLFGGGNVLAPFLKNRKMTLEMADIERNFALNAYRKPGWHCNWKHCFESVKQPRAWNYISAICKQWEKADNAEMVISIKKSIEETIVELRWKIVNRLSAYTNPFGQSSWDQQWRETTAEHQEIAVHRLVKNMVFAELKPCSDQTLLTPYIPK